ncbi:MAG: peroxiredoxin [Bacteriovoracaceae bacterium]
MTTETQSPWQLVGHTAPEWKATALADGEFKELSTADYKGKWKVLFFYPLDFTFVCPTEIIAYSEAIDKFKELNCEVIGASIDSQFTHLAWTERSRNEGGIGEIKYPLLADVTKKIAKDFGVLMENDGVALRGLFIIDDNDVVQHSTINNLSVGRNPEETLRLVEAYQYTAKAGEVCPAGWTKGSDTMKPDPKGSKEYFNKQG